jgi:hypothetical protein
MSVEELTTSDKKYIVSMRLNNKDRNGIQSVATRLFVRESELYRFAINTLLNRMRRLNDGDCTGSDLLPLFIEFREELNENLGLKKQQLFKIINTGNAHPDKFVGMADIELLVLSHPLLRQRLLQTPDALAYKDNDINIWLENYLVSKYQMTQFKDMAINEIEAKLEA